MYRHCKMIAEGLDVAPVIDVINQNPDLWKQITIRQKFKGTAHGDTETIYIRGPRAFTYQDYFKDLGSYDYPALDVLSSVMSPLLKPILDGLRITHLGRILIVKMKAGGHVSEHIDEGEYADHFSRFHVVIKTNEGCINSTGGEAVHWPVGTAWWFDHKQPHSAGNIGDDDRIHIIIDAVSPFYAANVPSDGVLR